MLSNNSTPSDTFFNVRSTSVNNFRCAITVQIQAEIREDYLFRHENIYSYTCMSVFQMTRLYIYFNS